MQKTLNEDTDGEDDNGCDGGSGDVQEEHGKEHGSRSTEPGDAGGFCCNVEKNFNAAHLPHPHPHGDLHSTWQTVATMCRCVNLTCLLLQSV